LFCFVLFCLALLASSTGFAFDNNYATPTSPVASAYLSIPFGGEARHQNEPTFGLRADSYTADAPAILDFQYGTEGLKGVSVKGYNMLNQIETLGANGGGSGINWALVGVGAVVAGVAYMANNSDKNPDTVSSGGCPEGTVDDGFGNCVPVD